METNKANEMFTISEHAAAMLQHTTGDENLQIAWFTASDYQRKYTFTPWQWDRLGMVEGDEYFLVYRYHDSDPLEPLYAVNVTGDSYLTAAAELLHLIARKF